MSTPEQKPEFKPPHGYTMRWREMKGAERGFVLRGPQGQELGFFKMKEVTQAGERRSLVDVFKSHLKPLIVGQTRDSMKAVILLEDSEGKQIGLWELGKPAKNDIEAMIKDLASR